MPDAKDEKSLSGAIPESLSDDFDAILFGAKPKMHKKKVLKAFAKWFIALDEQERKDFYKLADEPMEVSFREYVQNIVTDCLLDGRVVLSIADAIIKQKATKKQTRRSQSPKSR